MMASDLLCIVVAHGSYRAPDFYGIIIIEFR